MWDNVKSWYGQPFSEGMSATRWFLFFGLLIVIAGLWKIILSHLEG